MERSTQAKTIGRVRVLMMMPIFFAQQCKPKVLEYVLKTFMEKLNTQSFLLILSWLRGADASAS
jgi:hypothetical protein